MAAASYFNPEQHLVFHTDKNGQMMSGGYKINNALFEQNIPLFSKWSGDGGRTTGTGSGSSEDGINKYKSDNNDNGGVSANIIPAKFSDLFHDLAVPAGLFVMPPLFTARKYMLEQTDDEITEHKKSHEHSGHDDDGNANSEDDDEDDDSNANSEDEVENTGRPHKFAPVDIFDKLIALVTPTERIKLDKKTRKHRPLQVSKQNKGNSIKTKRSRPSRRNKNK
jgi:hypothetical protein